MLIYIQITLFISEQAIKHTIEIYKNKTLKKNIRVKAVKRPNQKEI